MFLADGEFLASCYLFTAINSDLIFSHVAVTGFTNYFTFTFPIN